MYVEANCGADNNFYVLPADQDVGEYSTHKARVRLVGANFSQTPELSVNVAPPNEQHGNNKPKDLHTDV